MLKKRVLREEKGETKNERSFVFCLLFDVWVVYVSGFAGEDLLMFI